ncbi:hypothetical protein R3I93_010617 [Phoxinus phoxinus]|uniref:Uncharacterized protein n=1 Tax=Phoxinus phoxinus TaxID=58324 RepID=A0AAN9CW73_9TELE
MYLYLADYIRREVSIELNPGLKPPSILPPDVGLVHVLGKGLNDSLHFILSNHGAPALLLVHTNSPWSTLQVDWPEFISRSSSGSLRVMPESSVVYSRAQVLLRLWEYNDPQTKAESTFYPPYELQNFTWSDLKVTQWDNMVTLCGRENTESFARGSFCLKFSAFGSAGHDKAWPSLLHNANSSQLRIWLDGVKPRGNNSRFKLELQSVGNSGFQERVVIRSSIDLYTHSIIMKMSQWVSFPINSSGVWGYSQWKPTAYLKPEPEFKDSTTCRHSELVSVSQIPPSGLVKAYFKEDSPGYGLNVSFGVTGDPFYESTEYISWTVVMGMGEPLVISFLFIFIIIVVELAIVISMEVCSCICRRMCSSGYQSID